MSKQTTTKPATAIQGTKTLRIVLIAVLVLLAFVASYRFAAASSGSGTATAADAVAAQGAPLAAAGSTASGASCACCGGASAGTGEAIEGAATLDGDVQRITVDTSAGYDPNVITLAAGVPAEITFKAASGCLGQVMSKDLGFFEDLTTGDKTVRLEADVLQPGTYGFSCGMEMVFGTIVVE